MTVTPFDEPEPLPLPNIPLLNKVRDHIGAHPEEWHQGSWRMVIPGCGTAYCFAGFAALFDGAEFASDDLSLVGGGWIEDHARQALGLTGDEANALFSGGGTLADIDYVLTRIYARAGEVA